MKKKLFAIAMAAILLAPSALQAKVQHLLPKPQQITATENVAAFALGGTVTINYSDGAEKCDLLEEFFTTNGCTLAESGGMAVNVSLVQSIDGAYDYELYGYENEAYTLDVTSSGITITAVKPTGIIRAAQTLTQMAEGWDGSASLEAVSIKDWPAFKLRGYMHDVGRSFISIEELIKQVKLFSRFKVNTFHWHLTENQAWRFEVKAYPQLTSDASMTRFAGSYYTQEDCKQLMEVAKKHGVIVIPEIDMPGHSEAFNRAMGFGMQTEEGKTALKKILDEVVEVFADAPYIHIGGDEVATTADYLNEMIAYVESKGKKAEIWNPINGIGQSNLNASLAQMWGTNGYLASGKANIDCRYNYTNHFDVFADLVGIYKSTVYYSQKGSSEVAGSISGCWNDRKTPTEEDIMAQNNVWANVIATAERTWIGGGKKYIDNATNTPAAYKANPYGGGVMLPNSGEEYEDFKNWEERFLFHKANSLKDEPIPYVKQTNVRWRITDAFPNGGTTSTTFAPEAYATTTNDDALIPETFTHEGKTYYTGMATGAGIYLKHTWGNGIIKAYYESPAYDQTAYAWTYVYSPEAQEVGAQIEFQNYSRSEQDPVPTAGNWDLYGSKIWINGTEITAPTYKNAGKAINREVDLLDENFPARTPIKITLKQGWNKVFLKLPYINAGYRLDKWMFTCVFTDTEGKNAVEGLIYSPNQCKDEATELVAAKISEIKRDRGNLIGTAIGLWPESTATELDSKIAEIEGTYDATKTSEERAAQISALEEAWTAFAASLTDANMNQPIDGNYYRMYTPLRGNRYATGNGVNTAITGPTEATSKASIWQFAMRNDGSYDIINLADGTYITTSGNPLKCVETQPMAGWSIKKAETTGNVIVVSGTNQFNQQKDGSYNLLNWGNGTNTTDDGCEYRMVDVTESIPPQPTVKLERLSSQTYPYAIDDALATKVFAKNNITIAVDVTMPASMSDNTRYALVCAADPTNAVTGATKTNSPYVAYGLNGKYPAYLPSSASGDKFTYRDFTFTGNTSYKVVYVIDCTNKKFSIYVDGVLKSSADYPVNGYELQSFSNFATNANAKLYIGGGAVSSNATYDKFGGKVHSVQFFGSALTPEQIADIEWPGKVLVIRNEVDGLAENNPNTHFGSLRATTSAGQTLTKLKRTSELTEIIYDNTKETTIDFTRAYRGFKFLGYYAGEQNLGKSFTITEELKNSITEENPLVAEFAPTNEATLFYDDDEFSYRIPAIATTGTGRLIAVSDYRHSLDDIGRYNFGTANPGIDLVIRTSDDNGKTWSATKTIAAGSGTRGSNDCAYGDAAIAVVGEKVLVMGAAGDVMFGNGSATAHNRTVRILSEDNGATWTAPQDISETLFIGDGATIKNGYTAFFGSGKLAVDENYNATGKARIYGAMLIKKEGVGNAIYVIYTDDLGVSWSILGGSQTHVTTNDEPKVEILPSGQILLSVRRGGGRQFNVFTYTDKANNAGSWANNVNGCGNGGSNTCNGEIFCIDAKKADGSAVKLLLQSQPKGGSGLYDRRNVTIWYKEVTDAAYTSEQIAADWTEGLLVSTQLSSYSTMSLQKDGKIAFFFEEAPCYGDDFTKGYSMVYIPLTIENITKGNFFSPDTDLSAERTVNVVLTDAEGNEYHDQLTCAINGIATAVTTKYPFITLGDNASLSLESEEYTYTNSVTLPFKVSNAENTVWHNAYFPSAGSAAPVYLSANEQNGEKVNTCVTNNVAYGNSTYNTYSKADNISWAIYSVDNGFTFKFKNKLTDKYIKVSGVANGNAQNAVYADEASATAFELVPDVASYNGDYALKAAVGETMGYLCATSWSYGYATHYQGNGHQGAWVKIVEAPDYAILIAEVNEVLSLLGDGLGKYTPAEADKETLEAAKTAMAESSNVKLNDLNSYKTLLDNATLNMPKEGQFFRIAYDYGGNAGKLYMQGVASTIKGVQFSDETGIASIWVYRDGALYSHHADRCLREVGNDRGLQAAGGKTTATFSTSIRVKGKYNIACTSYIHANSSGTNYFSDHCSTNNCPAHDLILEEVATVECSIGEHKIGTFYANDAMIIPDGIKAYVAITEPEMNEGTGIIRMTLVEDGIIPAKTGTVLRANEGTYTFTPAKTDGTTNTDGNLLIGYAGNAEYKEVTLPTDGSTNYVLTVKNGVAGFYRKVAGFKVYNNKAYLNVPNTVEARALYFNFDDDATGIVETESGDVKEEIYDLSGRRVQKVRKGIYIMDGKKVLK